MDHYGQPWTVIPNPEKRKVGSSILPLTTALTGQNAPDRESLPAVVGTYSSVSVRESPQRFGGRHGADRSHA
jgi:hypothetical protein